MNGRITLAVGCGAALGALLRALVGAAFPALAAIGIVNVAGSLAIGFFATVSAPGGRAPAGPVARQFVMAGLCGGFTTFSALSLEALGLIAAARPGAAAGYLAAVALGSVAAALAGHGLAAWCNR